jgi:hypothetical protein
MKACPLVSKQHDEQTSVTQSLSYYVNRLIQVTASSIAALVTPVIANCTNESMATRQPNNMNKLVPTKPMTFYLKKVGSGHGFLSCSFGDPGHC